MGMPIGSERIACVSIAVPPEPPAPISPPRSRRVRMKASNAVAIASTERPRSPEKTARSPWGWKRATSRAETFAVDALPVVERSTVTVRTPTARCSS